VIVGAAFFIGAQVGGPYFGIRYPWTYLWILAGLWVIRVLLLRLHFRELLLVIGYSIATAIAGVGGEAIAVWMGLMYYPIGPVFGTPLWLPGIWLHAALFGRALARAFFGATEAGNAPQIRFFPLRLHAVIDYFVPLTLVGVPLLFEFPEPARMVGFVVAAVHLVMTLLTDYPGGIIKWIPFRIHLTAELILGPALVSMPWVFAYADHRLAMGLHVAWGTISFLSFFVTKRTLPASYPAAAVRARPSEA
jgi:hypothetical protein